MKATIRTADKNDANIISRLAEEIWWSTYSPILSKEQIAFMLQEMYSVKALEEQMAEGMIFIILEADGIAKGFAGFSFPDEDTALCKIHKLYLHPSEQGQGTGKTLIEKVFSIAKEANSKVAELNVNRANPAFGFYKKLGFEIFETVDIPYHQFFLNDYVMRKTLG